MHLSLDLDNGCEDADSPDEDQLRRWISAALRSQAGSRDDAEIALKIVDETEGAALNQQYRGRQGATNVLSFPFAAVTPEPLPMLGDLVICAPVVAREAAEQNKSSEAHWAHMLVHGVLHLLGHDHLTDEDAERMEALETQIMQQMDYPAPYLTAEISP